MKDATLPIEAVAAERFRVGETDYRSLLTKIKGLGPDVLVPQGFRGETVAAVQQAVVDVGFDLKKTHLGPVCACADDPLYYKDLGKVGHGTTILSLYSTYAIPKGAGFAKWAAFRKAYQDRYGTLPGLLGVSAYDVVHIAAGAIERAGSLDRKKIIEALGKVEMDQMVLAMQGGTVHRPRAPRRGAPLPGGPSARGRGCDDAPRRAERAPRPRSLRPRLRARARTCHPRGLGRDAPAPPPGTDRLPGPRGVGAHGGLARVIPSNCACR